MAFNLREVFKALDDADADFVLVGGLAVIMHGHLRGTRDIDLVIGLSPDNCRKALLALEGLGLRPRLPVALSDFADPRLREDWITRRNMQVFQLWDPTNIERSVDLFVREPIDVSQMLAEAVVMDLDGVPIPVASIRHLIRLKQAAGRPQDLDDIQALREIAQETHQPET